jgi:hypothetical protein
MNVRRNYYVGAGALTVSISILLAGGCSHPPASVQTKAGLTSLIVTNETALEVCSFKLTTKATAGGQNPTNVAINLTMNSMLMPPNVIKLRPISPNVFIGYGTFTMGGPWTAKAKGQIGGRTVVLGNFPVSVKD